MTDNDIIKALELSPRCNPVEGRCSICPYLLIDDCAGKFPKDALSIINRQKAKIKELDEKNVIKLGLIDYQKAEIERLTEKVEALGDPLEKAHYEISELKAEIEKWQEECGKQSVLWRKNFESIFEFAKEGVRVKAITEFAERLKTELKDSKYATVEDSYRRTCNSVVDFCIKKVDQIAKEMKGETK